MPGTSEEFKMYHAFSVEELDEVAIVFTSPKWKNYFHPTEQTELQVDAAFYVVHKQLYQLLIYFCNTTLIHYLPFIF